MKRIIAVIILSSVLFGCGGGQSEEPVKNAATPLPDTSSIASDTSSVNGKGTDKIPSRTGTTGQGNTVGTGTATGTASGTAKDSIR